MSAGKPQNQALAIAYSVKRKPKKMAKGGMANESAKSESRPSTEEADKDSKEVSRNSGDKPAKNDSATSNVTIKQAQKPSLTKLSQPKMVGSDAFSVRMRDQHEENADQMDAFAPSSDLDQPKARYNEADSSKSGPELHDMAAQHNNSKQPYNKAIEDQYAQDMAAAEMKKVQSYAAGGMVQSGSPDMNMAEGGMIDDDMQPEPEAEDEHHDSIAAAIMSKRQKFAKGGAINGMDSIYSDDSNQADLKRNAEEDANMEDQSSFDALRKENYSESAGLEMLDQPEDSNRHGHEIDSDEHDKISKMRSRMNMRRQFSK